MCLEIEVISSIVYICRRCVGFGVVYFMRVYWVLTLLGQDLQVFDMGLDQALG